MIPIIVSTCVDCSFAYLEDGVVKCKAFPNGIPKEYLTIKIDPKDLEECNNGYKFTEIQK